MSNRQSSYRLMLAGFALIVISSVTFALPANLSLEWLGISPSQGIFGENDKKDDKGIAQKAEVPDLSEKSDEEVAKSKTDTGGFSADYKTQKNDVPDNLLAPLTGTLNIPGDYATLAAAITDLNTQGVGVGGVTFNLVAGNPQTAPAGGYIIGGTGSAVLASSSAANPIVFTGNGNTITASNAHTVGSLVDGIFKLIGADYITIQGFTMQENAANTVNTPAASNTMTEFGVALLYASLTDGSQNNTIQNNSISLNRTYLNTFGLYSNTRHSSTSITTSAEVTAASGSNSFNKVYGNSISNVNYGVVFIGAGTTIAAIDNGNDIGGGSVATGNTITNWGGGAALSGYLSLTGSNYCIFDNQQINDNVSFNTITSAALTQTATTGGLLKNYSVANPVGTITTTINSNIVQVTNNTTGTTTGAVIGLNNQGLSTLLATATMSMNNNTVQNSFLGGATGTTAAFTGITNLSLPGTINMNGNTVLNSGISSTAATNPTLVGISNSGAAATVNINNNILRSLSSTATSGQIQGIANAGAVTTAINIKDNQLGNSTSGFFSTSTATSGSLFGAVNSAGAAAALLTMTGNDIRGTTYNVAASAAQNYYNNQVFTGSTNISNNTITNITANTTGSVTMIGNSVSRTGTATATVNNNSIVTQYTKSGAGGTIAFYNSFGSSPSTVTEINTGNNFSNVTFSGATAFIGWRSADGTTPGPRKTVTNNTFSNITGGTSALTSVLYVGFSDNTFANNNVSGNVISNVSAAASISAIFSDGQNQNFFDNRINAISSTGGTASSVKAFELTGATTQNVFRNKIYDLQATASDGTVNGISISAGTTFNIYNNLIGDLRTPNANAANPLIGINSTSASTTSSINVSFNTIYLNASSVGATFGSSGIFHTTSATATTAALVLRDNIIVNNSTPSGAGLSAAYRRSNNTLTNYGAASNNNDLFASTLYSDGTNTITTIGAYKTFIAPRDTASFSENPTFLSTTGSSANFLHIDPSVATQIESGGITVSGITDDFDLQTRSVSTPDVGADEFTGIGIDLSAPIITYTNLPNTAIVNNPVLIPTITDATGVAAGANLPRIYYKRSTDAGYVSTQCTLNSGTAQNGQYGCLIDYSLLTPNTVTAGDIIQYFVVAQDTAGPNLGSNPTGATGANVNSITFSGTPNSYTILPSISGTKNVGSGGDYATLTAAVAAINAAVITGPTTLILTDATYPSETFPIVINANSGSSMTNTLTIKPGIGVSPAISGSSTSCIINLNGADWTTIDGSNAVGGTTRDLTITNTSTGTSSAIVCMESLGVNAGATNDTVKNLNLTGTTLTAVDGTLFGIFSGSTTINNASAGADNDNNTIQNNNITKTAYGIYSGGASAANKNLGTVITQNVMNAAAPNNLNKGGILALFEDGIQVTRNDISVLRHDGTTGQTGTTFGIALGLIPNNTVTVFTGSDVVNAQVRRNKINGITQLNSTGYSTFGIVVNTVTSGTTLVANNMVSGVISPSTATDVSMGILAGGGTGSTTQVYNNSVWMSGNRGSGATYPSYALAIGGSNPVIDIKNNIFANTQTTASTGKMYAIGTISSTFTNMTSSFNDLYVSGTNTFVGQTGGLGTSGTDRADLTAWNTITGQDAGPASISMNPAFVGTTDLHITYGSPAKNAGTTIGAITVDFDGDARPQDGAYDIGADEYVDSTAPDTVIDSGPTPDPSGSSTATFTFHGVDAARSTQKTDKSDESTEGAIAPEEVASFECQLDGGGYTPCSSPKVYMGLADGVHVFEVRAKDVSGNVDPTPASFTWAIDTMAPTGGITSGPASPTMSTSATFNFAFMDTTTVTTTCQLDAAPMVPCTSPVTYMGLSDGPHTFTVVATDQVMLTAMDTYMWTVDTMAPDTNITMQPSNPSNNASPSFSFTSTEMGSSFECKLDMALFGPCTSPQAYVGLADGSHTFMVRATDAVGNTDLTPASYTWVIDATAPDTSITGNPSNPTNLASAMFSFTGSDPGGSGVASFECKLDMGAFAACSAPQSYIGLSDGSHTFQVRAIDNAGNTDASPASFTWVIDTTSPDTSITGTPANPTNSTSAMFTFSGTDSLARAKQQGSELVVLLTFECDLDGGGFAPCSSPQSYMGLSEGSHTFMVRAKDQAGNTDPTPASFTWVIDVTPPVRTYTPLGATTSTAARTLVLHVTDNLAGVQTPFINYSVNGNPNAFVACTDVGGNDYNCVVPGQPLGSEVSVTIFTQDLAGNALSMPVDGYTVGAAAIPMGQYTNLSLGDGSTIGASVTVIGNLDLAGIVTTGANSLFMVCPSTITGAGPNSYVAGNVERQFCATGPYLFPVGTPPNGAARGNDTGADDSTGQQPEGTAGEYSPVTVTVNSLTNSPRLMISAVDTWLPGLGQTSSLSRYWDITQTVGSPVFNVDMTFKYLAEDIYGAEASYKVFKRSGGFTTQQPGSINTVAKTFTATGVTSFSQWGAGVAVVTSAPVSVAGRVTTAGGAGIRNAIVKISGNSLPEARTVQTGALGWYQFEGLQAGETYVIQVSAKRFRFTVPSRVVNVQDSLSDVDFVANPQE